MLLDFSDRTRTGISKLISRCCALAWSICHRFKADQPVISASLFAFPALIQPSLPTLSVKLSSESFIPNNNKTISEVEDYDLSVCPFHILTLGSAARTKDVLASNPGSIHANSLGYFVLILDGQETDPVLRDLVYSGILRKVVNLVLLMKTAQRSNIGILACFFF